MEGGGEDLGFDGEFDGALEDVGAIAIEAEDETAVDHDAGIVEAAAGLEVVGRGIDGLVVAAHVLGGDRFEADEETAAAGFVGFVEVAWVAGDIEGGGGLPDDAGATQEVEQGVGVLAIGEELSERNLLAKRIFVARPATDVRPDPRPTDVRPTDVRPSVDRVSDVRVTDAAGAVVID